MIQFSSVKFRSGPPEFTTAEARSHGGSNGLV